MARCGHQRAKAKRRSKTKTQRKEAEEGESCEPCKPYLTQIPHMEIRILKAKVWQGAEGKADRSSKERQGRRQGELV